MKHRTIILFTQSFPFCRGSEEGFIMPEIGMLARVFDRVVVVPLAQANSESLDLSAFPNVEVDMTWMLVRRSGSAVLSAKTVVSSWFWRGVFNGDWRFLGKNIIGVFGYFRVVRKLVAFKDWFWGFVQSRRLSFDMTIFYTFWFCEEATALGLIGVDNKFIKAITRMHGFDMFEFRSNQIVQLRKLRANAMYGLLQICPASECGTKYVRRLYPPHRQKITTEYLGVCDWALRGEKTHRNGFCILSVSNVVKLKRVDLVFRSLSALARAFPGESFFWTHAGGGHSFSALQELVVSSCPSNLTVSLLGAVSNTEVRRLLAQTQFDLGVHMSGTEGGTPIAILEMLEEGIPVVACDAGGVRECVNDEDGILLPIEIAPESFVEAVGPLIVNPQLRERKSCAAKALVTAKFNASNCRKRWVTKLTEIMQCDQMSCEKSLGGERC